MKKNVLIICILWLLPSYANSQSSITGRKPLAKMSESPFIVADTDKEIINTLKKIGTTYGEIYLLESNITEDFWEFIETQSPNYVDYNQNNKNFKRKCRESLFEDAKSYLSYPPLTLADSAEVWFIEQLTGENIGTDKSIKRILVDSNSYPNAYVTPNGVIHITDALINMLSVDELIGVLAHETTHFKLKHAEVSYFKEMKRKRSNLLWAGIASGVVVASNAYAQSSGVYTPEMMQNSTNQTIQSISDIYTSFQADAELYGFKYSRYQEIEADIVACRYLDWVGIGREHYISALKKIMEDSKSRGENVSVTKLYATHPALQYRIEVLEALR